MVMEVFETKQSLLTACFQVWIMHKRSSNSQSLSSTRNMLLGENQKQIRLHPKLSLNYNLPSKTKQTPKLLACLLAGWLVLALTHRETESGNQSPVLGTHIYRVDGFNAVHVFSFNSPYNTYPNCLHFQTQSRQHV